MAADVTSLSDVRFLTVAEVATIMRVSKMTVYRLVHSGELEAIRVGRSFRVPEQAVFGAATMLRESGEHPVILREAVTSPGGTTINAIRELEKHGVRAAFLAAIEAARDRGRELGSG